MAELLEVRGIEKKRGQRSVLDHVDLTLTAGTVVGLVGANGAGKSTLIGVLGGLLTPDSGEMTLDGEPYRPDSAAAARTAGVSVIEQDFAPPLGLTAAQAIFRNTAAADEDPQVLLERARALADAADIIVPLDALVDDLDRGQQAMVEVLRVSAEEAKVVILDEVASTLDDAEVAHLHFAIRSLKARGCASVYIAHRLDEVRALADVIVVLRAGQVVDVVAAREARLEDLTYAILQRHVEGETSPGDHGHEDVVLEVEGLTVGDVATDVTFHANAGEVLGIVGLRGSGARSVAAALGGLVPASADAVRIRGRKAGLDDAAIEYFDQADEQTVARPIHELAAHQREDQSDLSHLREAAREVARLGLSTSDIAEPAASLSGGDRQRLGIASALSRSEADVVVLAHPARGVDIGAKELVYGEIAKVLAAGRAVVLHSNDLSEMMAVAHRILVFKNGELVASLRNDAADEDLIMSFAEPTETAPPAPSAPAGEAPPEGRRARRAAGR